MKQKLFLILHSYIDNITDISLLYIVFIYTISVIQGGVAPSCTGMIKITFYMTLMIGRVSPVLGKEATRK